MNRILFVFVILVMYVAISELSAKKKAEQFCHSIKAGDSTSGLRERGIASGARSEDTYWQELGGFARQIDITYTGFYPGSDFICQIRERNGIVISKTSNIIRSIL